MHNEPKLFLLKLKQYLATIFARTMTRVVFGVPGWHDNQVLFTNIELPKAELYTPDPAYYTHLVTFKDTDFLDDLFAIFPLLKNGIVLLYTDKFFSALNKHQGDLTTLKLINQNDLIILQTKIGSQLVSAECGNIISSYQANRYKDIFASGLVSRETAIPISLKQKIAVDAKLTILDLGRIFTQVDRIFTCVLLNNQTTISTKEFLKNVDANTYTHSVLAVQEGDTVRINIWFSSPELDVLSTQPAVVWFPKQSKSEPIVGESYVESTETSTD